MHVGVSRFPASSATCLGCERKKSNLEKSPLSPSGAQALLGVLPSRLRVSARVSVVGHPERKWGNVYLRHCPGSRTRAWRFTVPSFLTPVSWAAFDPGYTECILTHGSVSSMSIYPALHTGPGTPRTNRPHSHSAAEETVPDNASPVRPAPPAGGSCRESCPQEWGGAEAGQR